MSPRLAALLQELGDEIQKNIKTVGDDLMERMQYEMKEAIAKALDKREKEMRGERNELLDDIASVLEEIAALEDIRASNVRALACKLKQGETNRHELSVAALSAM